MEERNKRKRNITTAIITVFLAFIAVTVWLFWDDIKEAYREWQANRAGWNKEENLGEIDTSFVVDLPNVEDNTVYDTDALGIKYKEYTFYNKEYKVSIPADWEISMKQSRLQAMHPDFKNNYSQIEISIIPLGEYDEMVSLTKLRNDTITLLDSSYRYHGYNDTYRFSIYNLSGDTVEENGFLYHPIDLTLISETVSSDKMKPAIATYYTFLDKEAYVIMVCGPKSKEVAVEEIAKKVSSSFETIENDPININEYEFSRLNEEEILNLHDYSDVKYNISSDWELLYDAGKGLARYGFKCYRFTTDPESPEYGITLSIAFVPEADLNVESYDSYVSQMYAFGNYPDEPDFYSAMKNKDAISNYNVYTHDAYTKDGRNGYITNYIKYFSAAKSDFYYNAIQFGNYPIKNYFYALPAYENYDVIVNITYNKLNEEIAYEYLTKFINSLSF